MEKKEQFKYYSTQRPVDIGTYPKSPENPLIGLTNYDSRIPVEGGAFRAWGELTYDKPLTEKEAADYELRPARQNLDVRRLERQEAFRIHKETLKPHDGYLYKMEANPCTDGIENRFFLQAYESIGNGRAIPRDVLYVGTPEKCRELLGRLTDGTLTQGQVKELFKKEMEPRPIAEQLKQAEKLAGENRAQPAPKKDAPDKGDR